MRHEGRIRKSYKIFYQLHESVSLIIIVDVHSEGVRITVCSIPAVIVVFLESIPLDHEFVVWMLRGWLLVYGIIGLVCSFVVVFSFGIGLFDIIFVPFFA